jgi:hypothetical protein
LREHRFTDTRRAGKHQVMRPGSGHLDGEAGLGLPHGHIRALDRVRAA